MHATGSLCNIYNYFELIILKSLYFIGIKLIFDLYVLQTVDFIFLNKFFFFMILLFVSRELHWKCIWRKTLRITTLQLIRYASITYVWRKLTLVNDHQLHLPLINYLQHSFPLLKIGLVELNGVYHPQNPWLCSRLELHRHGTILIDDIT